MKAEFVEKVSKNGNKYIVLRVHITPTYDKDVLVDKSEVELYKLYAGTLNAK